jgi:hypothetical protein
VLRACRRTLKPGAPVAYFNIFIAQGASREERRRLTNDHAELYTRADQAGLLRNAGFARIKETDVTAQYRRTLEALCQANDRHARSLRRVRGSSDFDNTQRYRRERIRGIDEGIIRRSLFVAERPAVRT